MNYLGKLYLIPTTLGDINAESVLPLSIKKIIEHTSHYIVENQKTARKSIKSILPEKSQSSLILFEINKHTNPIEYLDFIKPLLEGHNMGILSEAGCPGIADPGAEIVRIAHEKNIQVIPLVGPSSLLLALMASGMNGQSFAFNGYLPIEKSEKKVVLKNLEKLSFDKNQTQLFIETPYRNNKLMEDIVSILHPQTLLCVATDITLTTEYIKTLPIKDWKKQKVDLHNRPTVFIIYKTNNF